jgi:hypothetical protein
MTIEGCKRSPPTCCSSAVPICTPGRAFKTGTSHISREMPLCGWQNTSVTPWTRLRQPNHGSMALQHQTLTFRVHSGWPMTLHVVCFHLSLYEAWGNVNSCNIDLKPETCPAVNSSWLAERLSASPEGTCSLNLVTWCWVLQTGRGQELTARDARLGLTSASPAWTRSRDDTHTQPQAIEQRRTNCRDSGQSFFVSLPHDGAPL